MVIPVLLSLFCGHVEMTTGSSITILITIIFSPAEKQHIFGGPGFAVYRKCFD